MDVAMQFAKAPDEVRAAFDDVIKAAADEERLVNLAHAYENEVLPRAKGTTEQMKNEAMSYKQEKILHAEGNVGRFNAMIPEWQKASKLVQTRLYLETFGNILSKTTKIIVETQGSNNLIYLPLDKLMNKNKDSHESRDSKSKDGVSAENHHATSGSLESSEKNP